MSSSVGVLLVYFGLFSGIFACEYPPSWLGKTWTDDEDRVITFTTDAMTGLNIVVYADAVNTWNCFLRDGDVFILRGSKQVTGLGRNYNAYICMVSKVYNDTTFSYLLYSPKAPEASNHRIVTRDTALGDHTFCDVCTGSDDLTEDDVTAMAAVGDPCLVQPSGELGCTTCDSRCNPTTGTRSTTTPSTVLTTLSTSTLSTSITAESTTSSTTSTAESTTSSTTSTAESTTSSLTSTDSHTVHDQTSHGASTSGQASGQATVSSPMDSGQEVVILVLAVGFPILLMLIVVSVGIIVVIYR